MAEVRQDHDRDKDKYGLDRMLDLALAKYAAVGPRDGLEDRVLANLRVQRTEVPNSAWHGWSAMAAVAAVVVMVVTLAWRSGKTSHPTSMNHPTATTPLPERESEILSKIVSNSGGNGVRRHGAKPAGRPMTRRAYPLAAAAQPRLDQFPSPQPLSEQERTLASYVAEDPERAVLIARLRTESLRQDELEEMKAFPSGDRDAHSENSGATER